MISAFRSACIARSIHKSVRQFDRTLTMSARTSCRQFAPLGKAAGDDEDILELKGVVFDVDGTLCKICHRPCHVRHLEMPESG